MASFSAGRRDRGVGGLRRGAGGLLLGLFQQAANFLVGESPPPQSRWPATSTLSLSPAALLVSVAVFAAFIIVLLAVLLHRDPDRRPRVSARPAARHGSVHGAARIRRPARRPVDLPLRRPVAGNRHRPARGIADLLDQRRRRKLPEDRLVVPRPDLVPSLMAQEPDRPAMI